MAELALMDKYNELKNYLRSLGSVGVAFSSGVDSAFLLYAAVDAYKDNPANVLAITATSEFFPYREREEARVFCDELGVKQIVTSVNPDDIPMFAVNPPDRCYLCKKHLFKTFLDVASDNNIRSIVEGSNLDDLGDYRPGLIAISELNIISPLRVIGFTKNEIRELSRMFNLPTWNKPSFACLASRFPYGQTINKGKLHMVEAAEDFLLSKGFTQLRVRIIGDKAFEARIELIPDEINMFESVFDETRKIFTELGFEKVTLDSKGYRTGSMNEALSKQERDLDLLTEKYIK